MILVSTKLPRKKTFSCTKFHDKSSSLPLRKESILQNIAVTKNFKLSNERKHLNVLYCE